MKTRNVKRVSFSFRTSVTSKYYKYCAWSNRPSLCGGYSASERLRYIERMARAMSATGTEPKERKRSWKPARLKRLPSRVEIS